jgi:hypothetical protein
MRAHPDQAREVVASLFDRVVFIPVQTKEGRRGSLTVGRTGADCAGCLKVQPVTGAPARITPPEEPTPRARYAPRREVPSVYRLSCADPSIACVPGLVAARVHIDRRGAQVRALGENDIVVVAAKLAGRTDFRGMLETGRFAPGNRSTPSGASRRRCGPTLPTTSLPWSPRPPMVELTVPASVAVASTT